MSKMDINPVELIAHLGEVVITDELSKRPARTPDYRCEHLATSALIEELASSPTTVLQRLCELLVELSLAETAGVSLHEVEEDRLRWVAVAGEWASHLSGVMPFDASPCGAVIIRDEPMLFARPHERFPAADIEPRIQEMLLVPFRSEGKPIGTLWVMTHDEAGRFDAEDLRLLTSLAHVAAAADRTVRALAEAEAGRRDLEAGRNLLQATMDASPDMIQVFEAIRDADDAIVDFRWVLNNHTSESRYGKVQGESLLERNPGVLIEGIFEDFRRVPETGEPIQVERHYVHEQFDGWFYQSVVKLGDGVATTTKEITEWKQVQADVLRLQEEIAQAKLRQSEEKFRILFDSIDEGLAIVEMIYDDDGGIVDMIFRQVNAAYERQGGIYDVVGRSVSEMLPGIEDAWLERYEQVATTGRPMRVEDYQQDVDRWFDVYFSRIDAQGRFVAIVFNDVSERRRLEAGLRERQERQAFLLRFSDDLRRDDDERAIGDRAIAMLYEELELDRCYITFYRPAENAADFAYQIGNESVPPLPATVSLLDFPEAYEQVRHGTFVVDDDLEREGLGEAERDNSRALGLRAIVASTARGGDMTPLSSLAVVSSRPRRWTPGEIALVEEAAERTWAAMGRARAEAALRESERKLAEDLADAEALRSLAERLVPEESFDAIYDEVLSVTLAIARADAGTIQIFEPETKTLRMIASRNFTSTITEYFDRVDAGSRTACGAALVTGRRAFVDFPDQDGDPGCRLLAGEGMRTAVAVPLTSRSGAPLGMLNAHWRDAGRRSSDRELRFLDLLARQVADLIERRRGEAALRESELRFRGFGENSSDALWIIDVETRRLEYLSPAYERIWGESRAAVMTDVSRWTELTHPDDRTAASQAMARLLAGEPYQADYRIVRPDGEVRWIRDAGFPIRVDGVVRRGGGIAQDVTDLKRAEAAVREREARLRVFGEASQDILWIRDAETLRWQYLTPAFEAIYGLSCEEALSGNDYRGWLELIVPEDRAHATENIRRVKAGEQVAFEFRIRRPVDGAIRWLRNTDFPIRDEAGEVTLIGGIGHDFTELRETELRLQALIDGIPQLVWRAGDPGLWTWASPQWTAFTGQREIDSHGWGWLTQLHPDDRAAARRAWSQAVERGELRAEYRVGDRDGAYRWHQTQAAPVRDKGGEIVEWLGTSTDIHDLRLLQDRQQVMVQELQHRTRNLITVVNALSKQTLRNAASLDDFDHRFSDRLSALSRVQGLLSHLSAGRRVTFDELLGSELTALGAPDHKVTLDGPEGVPLRSAMVQTFSLALHELATNALKYGALAAPDGHLTVRWTVMRTDPSEPRLRVDWRETGVVMTHVGDRPRGGGYGRELIERALPYQLDAETTYEMTAGGVHCTIDVPASTVLVGSD